MPGIGPPLSLRSIVRCQYRTAYRLLMETHITDVFAEHATRAGSLFRCQISAICSKRTLFPYNDFCHVNYSAHELSVH